MANVTNEFFDNFLKHSKRIVEFGFAYLFAHPELFPTIDVEMKKIKGIELIASNNPEKKQQCYQLMQRAYFNYLIKLTKFGFQYVKNNPEFYRDVAPLHKLLMEYNGDCTMKAQKQKPMKARRNLFGETSSDDYIWEQTFNDISALNDRLDAFRNRLNASSIHTKPSCDAFPDQTLKKFNKQLEDKLKDIREKKQHRMKNTDKETLSKINDRLEKLMKEIDDKKHPRSTGQRKVINIDSDTNSSEVLISFEHFAKPLKEQQLRVQTPRAGRIERHLVIPIEAKDTPKITPRYCITKSPVNGHMQVDLKLNFEDGILYRDKLVDGIWIENALPVQNLRNKVK